MNYFVGLGIIFGLAALLKPVYMHVIPWDEQAFLAKTYGEKRPVWMIPVAILGLALVALTWYMHFTTEVPYSIILTILFSLTAVKGLSLLFDYKRFQTWVAGLLSKNRGRGVIVVDIVAGIIGLAIILLTIFVYWQRSL